MSSARSLTLPDSCTVSYGYDSGGRLSTLTDWLAKVTSFTYVDNSRRTGIVHPNGVASAYAYDAASQVTSTTQTGSSGTLLAFANTYDANGNRTSVTKDGGTPESYTLDSLNRLTGVTYADGDDERIDRHRDRLSRTERAYDVARRAYYAGQVGEATFKRDQDHYELEITSLENELARMERAASQLSAERAALTDALEIARRWTEIEAEITEDERRRLVWELVTDVTVTKVNVATVCGLVSVRGVGGMVGGTGLEPVTSSV